MNFLRIIVNLCSLQESISGIITHFSIRVPVQHISLAREHFCVTRHSGLRDMEVVSFQHRPCGVHLTVSQCVNFSVLLIVTLLIVS